MCVHQSVTGCVVAGGEEQSRLVGGDVTSVDLDQLDSGAQYEVQVMALVQNREGNPISVRITTRESYRSSRFHFTIQNTYPANKIQKAGCTLMGVTLQHSSDAVKWNDPITVKINVSNESLQKLYFPKLVSDIVIFSLSSWCRHAASLTPHHSFAGSRGYPEFCAACLESFTGGHRVHPSMGR